jgi:flagellar protein FliO/FliZ
MNGSLGLGLLWFVLIIAAIPLVLWLVKRTPYGAAMSGGAPGLGAMRTVASIGLGPHQRVVTIEVGQGDERRWLVLGVTPQSINALHTLSPQGEAATPSTAAPNFANLLGALRRTKERDASH